MTSRILIKVLLAVLLGCGGGGSGTTELGSTDPGIPQDTHDIPSDQTAPADPQPEGSGDQAVDQAVTDDPAGDNAGDEESLDPGLIDVQQEGPQPDTYAYATCFDLFACTQQCQDGPCKMNCVSSASPGAVADLMALKTCMEKHCPVCLDPKTPQDQKACEECRSAAAQGPCAGEVAKCVKMGTKPCAEVVACISKCQDIECGMACSTEASMPAQGLLDALGACLVQACPGLAGPMMTPCVEKEIQGACKAEYEACASQTCVPKCGGKECGPDGCGGDCGPCAPGCTCENGMCMGCEAFQEIDPSCAHVPFLVPAGKDVPVAVFVVTASCAMFDHVDVDLKANPIKVRLMGKTPDGMCPPCIFTYAGLVSIPGLLPGPHQVQVGKLPPYYVVATAGDIPAPACDAACAPPLGSGWKLSVLSETSGLKQGCGDYSNVSSPATFTGSCQHYQVSCEQWPGPKAVDLCSGNEVFFDIMDTSYTYTATRCEIPMGMPAEAMVGIFLGGEGVGPKMFMFEK